MATIGQIRERVNQIKPNSYDVARWIGELDARIALDVMLMDISECEQFAYHRKPRAEQETIEPLLKFPHDECYDLWLFAKIDSSDGETELYQNDMNMFNAMFGAYEEWFVSTYDPANNGTGQIRYYITAYSLAVQQGFQGDMNAWLASLRGLTGKSAYEYAVEGGYTGSEEAYKTYMATLVETDTSFTKAGAAADAAAVGAWKGQLEQQLGKNLKSITDTIDGLGKTVGMVSETAESAKQLGERALPKSGGTMAGQLSMGGHRLTELAAPEGAGDGVNKGYVEDYVNGKRKTFQAVILASGWSATPPYTNTVNIIGVQEADMPHIAAVITTAQIREAWCFVTGGTAKKDAIEFTALEDKPTVDIPIQVEVLR